MFRWLSMAFALTVLVAMALLPENALAQFGQQLGWIQLNPPDTFP